MPTLMINVIDHRERDLQAGGEIIGVHPITEHSRPGPEYADFCALYETWYMGNQSGFMPDIVGFFGYRKYLAPVTGDEEYVTQAHAPGWYQCTAFDFDGYRDYLADWDGDKIKEILAQRDILQAPPFPLTNGKSMMRDFQDSRSTTDAWVLDTAVRYGAKWKICDSTKIYPYLFITRWSVFDRMMR